MLLSSNENTVLLYTTCTYELYFCEHNSFKTDTHTHGNCTLYIFKFIHRFTVLLYTTWRDGLYFQLLWTQLYIAVQVDATYTHCWCTHCSLNSCTAVCFYCRPVSVRLCCQLVLTNERPSNIKSWSAVLSINKTSISSCMSSKQLSSQNNSSFRGPGSWVLYCNAWRLSSGSWGLYLVHEGYIYWFKVIYISYSMFTTSLPRERDM